MYPIMDTTGWTYGLSALWAIHILSVIAFFTGLLLFVVFAIKTFNGAQLKAWAIWLLVIGSIACLATIAVIGRPWVGFGFYGSPAMMRGQTMNPMMQMMLGGNWQSSTDTAATAQEEAEGKALYEKLQAKQTSCADLSDDDFDLIGDYFMGQQMGAAHGQMNAMMQQMMGEAGEKQMHIIMGKRLSGCSSEGKSAQFPQGMMNGGGMVGGSNSANTNTDVDTHHTSSAAR